jgi:hypothetical protein
MTQVTKVIVSGARGPRGLASGSLGDGSVDSDTITNDSGEKTAILTKLGLSSLGQSIVGGATAADVRTTLGLGTSNLGALAAGTTADVVISKTFSGHSGGTTDFRGTVVQTILTGANSVAEIDQETSQLELRHTAGTLTSAFGRKAYARLGLSGSTTGDVTSIRVNDAHVANEGSGDIGVATCYFADGVDLLEGTGAIGVMMGFHAGNQGHASRVTTAAIGFSAGDQTAGAPFTAGFRSQVSDGTNKWAFYSEGSAPSQFTGKVGIGSATRPTDVLEMFQGYAKLCGSTNKLTTGSYHELRTGNSDWTCFFSNSHASAPQGLRMRFSAAAPNNTTQRFIYCDDNSADRFVVWSNGNVVNANNSYGAISDRRLKEGIKPAGPQLDDIMSLQLRKYQLKADIAEVGEVEAPWLLGLVDDEVADVSPGLVIPMEVDDRHVGEIEIDGVIHSYDFATKRIINGVNYSVVSLKLLGAFQELAARSKRQKV